LSSSSGPRGTSIGDTLAAIRELHTTGGKHVIGRVPFPEWIPPEVKLEADETDLA